MKVFHSSWKASLSLKKGSAVAIGNYDGVHMGHRYILGELNKEAKVRKVPSVLYTFEPHPVRVLSSRTAPPLINTLEQKIELLKECHINAVIFEKFTLEFSKLDPDAFVKKYLVGRLNSRFVTVGYDFTFGKKRQGNTETLLELGKKYGFDVRIIPPKLKGDTLVSSSIIRQVIQEGRVKEAIALLNRPFFMEGTVIKGKQRGKKLGIPTANLQPINELIPPVGVYLTKSVIGKKEYGSVTNVGFNPTFGQNDLSIETHIFDFNRTIYGQKIRLYFLDRLRGEMKFNDIKDLIAQIKKDITQAKHMHSKMGS